MNTKTLFGTSMLTVLLVACSQLSGHGSIISGYVWLDDGSGGGTAGDGLINGTESGSEMTIRYKIYNEYFGFYEEDGASTVSTWTTSGGAYSIDTGNLELSAYPSFGFMINSPTRLYFELPEGYNFTLYAQDGGITSPDDSDVMTTLEIVEVDGVLYGRTGIFYQGTTGDPVLPFTDNDGLLNAGYVPVPEPANVALAVFGGLVLAGGAVRRLRRTNLRVALTS